MDEKTFTEIARSLSLAAGVSMYVYVQYSDAFKNNGIVEIIAIFLILHAIMLEIRSK